MIDRPESSPLYCWSALEAHFVPACLESFRAQPYASQLAACRNFRNSALFYQGAVEPGDPGSQSNMSSVKATQLRPGMVIQHEGQLYTVFSTDHRTPGNK